MHTPVISVLMAIYNGERFAKEAIESILDQTFTDFELILIDDCSTDNTLQIMKQYDDPRVVIIENERNLGLARSLNRGLEVAQGKYIARMDADDISMPNRFSKQIEYLEKHFDIDICGSWIKSIDINGNSIIFGKCKYPLSSNVINCYLLFQNPVAHPTVIFRKRIFQKIDNYNPEFNIAQDYDLWTRTIGNCKIANIPDFLLKYRIHGNSLSNNFEKALLEEYKIRKNVNEKFLNSKISGYDDKTFSQWITGFPDKNMNDILEIDALISKIYKQYMNSIILSKDELKEINAFFAEETFNLALIAGSISIIFGVKLFFCGFKYGIKIILFPLKQIAIKLFKWTLLHSNWIKKESKIAYLVNKK